MRPGGHPCPTLPDCAGLFPGRQRRLSFVPLLLIMSCTNPPVSDTRGTPRIIARGTPSDLAALVPCRQGRLLLRLHTVEEFVEVVGALRAPALVFPTSKLLLVRKVAWHCCGIQSL